MARDRLGHKARQEAKRLNEIAAAEGYVATFKAVEIIDQPLVPGPA